MSVRTLATGPYIRRGETLRKFYQSTRVTDAKPIYTFTEDDLTDRAKPYFAINVHPEATGGRSLSVFEHPDGLLQVRGWLSRYNPSSPLLNTPLVEFPFPIQSASGAAVASYYDPNNIGNRSSTAAFMDALNVPWIRPISRESNIIIINEVDYTDNIPTTYLFVDSLMVRRAPQ